MRTLLFILGACLISCTSARPPEHEHLPPAPSPSQEYTGVYISTPDEDYFTPCGIERTGDTWSLRFRDNDPHAPFLKMVTAIRGYPPLTHFIRVRGRLNPASSHSLGFQTRELAVDTVLDVKESLEPCVGFGVPAVWSGFRESLGDHRAIAMSNDRSLFAVMDNQRQVRLWSTQTGLLIRKFAAADSGNPSPAATQIVFSDDAKLVVAGGLDGFVRVWRTQDGKRVFLLRLKDRAAVAKEMARIPPRVDAPGWRPVVPPSSYTPVRHIVFNKGGTMIATTNLFSTIVWSLKTGKKLAEFPIGTDFRRKVFFVGDKGLLMSVDSGRMTLRTNLDAEPVIPPGTDAAETDSLAMSPDRRSVVVGTWGDSVFLWSLAGSPPRVLRLPGFTAQVMAFSPDGNIIAFGGASALYLYDLRTGAPIKSFHNFPGALSHAWFSADGKSIIVASFFDDRFRIVYVDPEARPATEQLFDDSLSAKLPLGPAPSTSPRTVGGIVSGPNQRAVPGAEVAIYNGDAPDSVIARTTTSSGGYFSFNGIRFRHVLIRAQKSGFAPAVRYIHLTRWPDDGPWGIELKPETRGSGELW